MKSQNWVQILLGVTLLIVPISAISGEDKQSISTDRDLDEIARVATTMVDGDVAQKIMTPRALEKMFASNPMDPSTGGDNFDVNADAYIQVKKTLIRLARLVDYPVDCNLWMPFLENPSQIQILIRQRNEMSQFWKWGDLLQDIPSEMKEVLQTGKRKVVLKSSDLISVLAPVYNSLGDIVGIVEVVSHRRNS